ncbi:hypothetical protein AVEN_261674-1 [Araneus ventricosus]|uniref:Uncharacterized protein n=1 Tax=Araneus ventricosus TaxID=182803 RepID=A0A4Y2DUH9_ARAVE|nr:hypothetical protein AVEN_261674-1 [Araneus ventricosus]
MCYRWNEQCEWFQKQARVSDLFTQKLATFFKNDKNRKDKGLKNFVIGRLRCSESLLYRGSFKTHTHITHRQGRNLVSLPDCQLPSSVPTGRDGLSAVPGTKVSDTTAYHYQRVPDTAKPGINPTLTTTEYDNATRSPNESQCAVCACRSPTKSVRGKSVHPPKCTRTR